MGPIRARWVCLGLTAAATALLAVGLAGGGLIDGPLGVVVLALFAAAIIVQCLYHRCPSCGRFLYKNYAGSHCQHCGHSLTEEAP